jgi:hypothetical protein
MNPQELKGRLRGVIAFAPTSFTTDDRVDYDGPAAHVDDLCRNGADVVVAAIVLWNTVYLERVVQALRDVGKDVDDTLLPHLSPLGWEHINLNGDYTWRQSKQVERGNFRRMSMTANA